MLHSHKNGITYLEHVRIISSDDRLAFVRAEDAIERHYSIPYMATAALLLGPGTSLTQAAARKLAEGGVALGFTAGGGTPLFLASQSEYRPTEYMQAWASWWFDDAMRLEKAKALQAFRLDHTLAVYAKHEHVDITDMAEEARREFARAADSQHLLLAEARFAKRLYAAFAKVHDITFTRTRRGEDPVNRLLDNGNYLAYGLAAAVLWGLGISHAFAVMHGKTRRGGLVFDIADLVKDAHILPLAFRCAVEGVQEREYRKRAIERFENLKILPLLFDETKRLAAAPEQD